MQLRLAKIGNRIGIIIAKKTVNTYTAHVLIYSPVTHERSAMEAADETPGRLEPMRLGDGSTAPVNEVLAELAFKAGRLDNALRGPLQAEAADLVRLRTAIIPT